MVKNCIFEHFCLLTVLPENNEPGEGELGSKVAYFHERPHAADFFASSNSPALRRPSPSSLSQCPPTSLPPSIPLQVDGIPIQGEQAGRPPQQKSPESVNLPALADIHSAHIPTLVHVPKVSRLKFSRLLADELENLASKP